MAVEVELASAPKLVVGVKGKLAPPLAEIVPQETVPDELVTSACVDEQLEMPEMVRLVVEAVPK